MAQLGVAISNIVSNFTLAEALELLKPLSIFMLGIAVYSFFIFKFYRFVAKRDVFNLDMKKYENSKAKNLKKTAHGFSYIIKHLIVLPILIFFWFIVLSIILAFLSKQDNMQTILLISFALVGVIRVMSYYSEDLSKDLAKMLPFALLGVFLVDISYFSVETSLLTIKQLPALWKTTIYYLIFIIFLEFILRIIFGFYRLAFKKSEDKDST